MNVQCTARPLEVFCFLGFCLHSILGVAQMPSSKGAGAELKHLILLLCIVQKSC